MSDNAKPFLLAVALCIGCAMTAPSIAADFTVDDLRAYAAVYPEVFNTMNTASAQPPVADKQKVVALLLKSYNGSTDFPALSAALRPTSVKPQKAQEQTQALLAERGLSWEKYQLITRRLANDPVAFQAFLGQLDAGRMNRQLLARVYQDPTFLQSLHSSDQQVVVKNLASALTR